MVCETHRQGSTVLGTASAFPLEKQVFTPSTGSGPVQRLSLRYKVLTTVYAFTTVYALMLPGNGIQRLRAQVLAAQFWTQVPILKISSCMALGK